MEAQNLPRTVEEHPNWRRKLRLPLERIERSETVAAGIALIAAARDSAGADEPDGAGQARYSAIETAIEPGRARAEELRR
ncbi:MAG: hypothetical protein EXR63_03175 [Dehalococcoidia bacterium]|nr:hypothetical protein [Dehalococcoidia bacterium]